MTDWYFAYGSNMNPARMAARGLTVVAVQGGHLPGYRLSFDKRATGKQQVAYANIAYAPGQRVEGVLYQLAAAADIALMDPFEGNPVRYSREVFPVISSGATVNAWVYVANPAMRSEGLLPEKRYMEHLLAGRQWHSQSYHQWLLDHPVIDTGVDPLDSGNDGLIYNG